MLDLSCARSGCEWFELALSDLPIDLNPIRRLKQNCLQFAELHRSNFVAGNETDLLQYAQMTGNSRKRNI